MFVMEVNVGLQLGLTVRLTVVSGHDELKTNLDLSVTNYHISNLSQCTTERVLSRSDGKIYIPLEGVHGTFIRIFSFQNPF